MDKIYSEEQLKYVLLAFYTKREKLVNAIALALITKDLIDDFKKKPVNSSRKYAEPVFSCCLCEEKENIFKTLWKKQMFKNVNCSESAIEEAARRAWFDIVRYQSGESFKPGADGINQAFLRKHGLKSSINEVENLTKSDLETKWSHLTEKVKTELETCLSSIMKINDNTYPVTSHFKPCFARWALQNVYLTLLTSERPLACSTFLQNSRSIGLQIKAVRNPASGVAIKYVICKQCLSETEKRSLSITDVFTQCLTDFANNEFCSLLKFPEDVPIDADQNVISSDNTLDGMPTQGGSKLLNGNGNCNKERPVRKSGRGNISSKKDRSFVYYSNIDVGVRPDKERQINSKKAIQTKKKRSFTKKHPNLDIIVVNTSAKQDIPTITPAIDTTSTSEAVMPEISSPVTPPSVSKDEKPVPAVQHSKESIVHRIALEKTKQQMVRMRHIGSNKIVVVPSSALIKAQQKGCLVPVNLSSNSSRMRELSKYVTQSLNHTTNQHSTGVEPQNKPLVVQIVNGRVRRGISAGKGSPTNSNKMQLNGDKTSSVGNKSVTSYVGANSLRNPIKRVPIGSSRVKFVKSVQLKNHHAHVNRGTKSGNSFPFRNLMKVEVPISQYSQTKPKTLFINNFNERPLQPVNNFLGIPVIGPIFPIKCQDNAMVNSPFAKVKLRIAGNRKFVIKDNFRANTTNLHSVINKPTLEPALPKQLRKSLSPKKSDLRQILSPSKTPSKRKSLKIGTKSMSLVVAEYMLDLLPSDNQVRNQLKKKTKKRVEKSTSLIPVPYETNFLCIDETIERLGWKAYWYRRCRCSKIREKDVNKALEQEETHSKQVDISSWLPQQLSQKTIDLLSRISESTEPPCLNSSNDMEENTTLKTQLIAQPFKCIDQNTKKTPKAKLSANFNSKIDADSRSSPSVSVPSSSLPAETNSSYSDKSSFWKPGCVTTADSSEFSSTSCSLVNDGYVEPCNSFSAKPQKRKALIDADSVFQTPLRLKAKYKKDKNGNWAAVPSEVTATSEFSSTRTPDPKESNTEDSVLLNLKSDNQFNSVASIHMEDRMGMTHDHGVRRCARATMLRRKALMKRALDIELKSKSKREKTESIASIKNILFSSFQDQSMSSAMFDLVSPHPICFKDNVEVMIEVLELRGEKLAARKCLLIKEKIPVDTNTKKYELNPFYSYLTSPNPVNVGGKIKRPKTDMTNKSSASSKKKATSGGELINKLESIWNQDTSASTSSVKDFSTPKSDNTVEHYLKLYHRKEPVVSNEITSALAIKNLSSLRRVFTECDTCEISSESAQFIVSVVKSETDVRNDLNTKKSNKGILSNKHSSLINDTEPLVEANNKQRADQIDSLDEEVDVIETDFKSECDQIGEKFTEVNGNNTEVEVPCTSKGLDNLISKLSSSISARMNNFTESSDESINICDDVKSVQVSKKDLEISPGVSMNKFVLDQSENANHSIDSETVENTFSEEETNIDVCTIPEGSDEICKSNPAKSDSLTCTRSAAFVEIYNYFEKLLKTDFNSTVNCEETNGVNTRLQKEFTATSRLSNVLSSKYCFTSTGKILQKGANSKRRRRKKGSFTKQYHRVMKLQQPDDVETEKALTSIKDEISVENKSDDQEHIEVDNNLAPPFQTNQYLHFLDVENKNTSTTSQEPSFMKILDDDQVQIKVEELPISPTQMSHLLQTSVSSEKTDSSLETVKKEHIEETPSCHDISDAVLCDSAPTYEASKFCTHSDISIVGVPYSLQTEAEHKNIREPNSHNISDSVLCDSVQSDGASNISTQTDISIVGMPYFLQTEAEHKNIREPNSHNISDSVLCDSVQSDGASNISTQSNISIVGMPYSLQTEAQHQIIREPTSHNISDAVLCDSIQTDGASNISTQSDISIVGMPYSLPTDAKHEDIHEPESSKEFTLGEIVVNSSPKKRRRDWDSTELNGLYWSQVIDFDSTDLGKYGLSLRRRNISNEDSTTQIKNLVNKRKSLGCGYSSSRKMSDILEADQSSLKKHGFNELSDYETDDSDSDDDDTLTERPLQSLFTKSLNVERVRSWMLGLSCPKPLVLKNAFPVVSSPVSNHDDTFSANLPQMAAKRRKKRLNEIVEPEKVEDEGTSTSYNTLTDDISPLISRAYVPLVRCSTNLNEENSVPLVRCSTNLNEENSTASVAEQNVSENESPFKNQLFVVKKRLCPSEYRPKGISIARRRHDEFDVNNNERKIMSTIFPVTRHAGKYVNQRLTVSLRADDCFTLTHNVTSDTETDIDVERVSVPILTNSDFPESHAQRDSNVTTTVNVLGRERQMRKCRLSTKKNDATEKPKIFKKKYLRNHRNLRTRCGKGEKNRLQSIRRAVFAEIKESPRKAEKELSKRGVNRMLLQCRCATKGSFLSRLLGCDNDGHLFKYGF